jgi:hypothetical protein
MALLCTVARMKIEGYAVVQLFAELKLEVGLLICQSVYVSLELNLAKNLLICAHYSLFKELS